MYVCRGCGDYSVGKAAKVASLKCHMLRCKKLQELMKKDHKSVKKVARTGGSILKWIADGNDKTSKQKFCDAWMMFCARTNLSVRALSSPEFLYAANITKEFGGLHAIFHSEAHKSQKRLKKDIIASVREKIEGHFVTLFVDGWKVKYRKEHAHAIMFADWNGEIVFHCLEGDLEKHDHTYLIHLLERNIREIEDTFGVHVVGAVADNASVMDRTLKGLKNDRPLFVHHCAAHWMQLLLNDVGSHPLVAEAESHCSEIVSVFEKRGNLKVLQKTCSILQRKVRRPARPCETRWNSRLDSFISVLHLETEILLALQNDDIDAKLTVTSEHFEKIRHVCNALLPVAIATDRLQGDDAGLLMEVAIMTEMESKLMALCEEMQCDLPHTVLEKLYSRNEKTNWLENTRLHAAALLLAFKPSILDDDTAEKGVSTLLEDLPPFIKQYCEQHADKTTDQIRDILESQLASYAEKNEGHACLDTMDMEKTIARWKLNSIGKFSMIAQAAKMIFSIRSSEAMVERCFSRAAWRLSPHRNRLSISSLSDELFIALNRPSKKQEFGFCKTRLVPQAPITTDEAESEDSMIQVVEDTVRLELPTNCIPVGRESEDPSAFISLCKCEGCGNILGVLDSTHDGDAESENQWWRCCRCLSAFCPICSDVHLDDDTGLCYMCDNPELAIMSAAKARKKSNT